MPKKFNITGTCIPEKHYMVDISNKLEQIIVLIEEGAYFAINKPRQYGKTTTLFLLHQLLAKKQDYLPIKLSFEGLGSESYENEKEFTDAFISIFKRYFLINQFDEMVDFINKYPIITKIRQLDYFITEFTMKFKKKFVLTIDEVDQSCNNQLFLDFLGMLRKKYLLRNEGQDFTFHTVILAGVNDVKSLKLKLRPDSEKTYNSPWNIAADFKVDLSFNPKDISTMLADYAKETNIDMDIKQLSSQLYYYTSGYPFLVSKLCKIIDEEHAQNAFDLKHLDNAVKQLLTEQNTNFESLIKNLENDNALYAMVEKISLDGAKIVFNEDNLLLTKGMTHGIFINNGFVKIHNRIYEQRIYNYMILNLRINELFNCNIEHYNLAANFITKDKYLDFEKIILKFQEFMKYEYSQKDSEFLERNGRLIFLAFLKPIINSYGFDFKEVQISEEKRLDVVVTWSDKKYLVELKIWHGQKAHNKGIKQLCDYLDKINLDKGYLIIYDFRKPGNKKWKHDTIKIDKKQIFMVWV